MTSATCRFECFERCRLNRDGGVMLAEPGSARPTLVLGLASSSRSEDGLVLGAAHPAKGEVHAAKRFAALDEGEALA